eukprot:scaffold1072_cov124-Cylindrotheca_fusiformis.AAC.7
MIRFGPESDSSTDGDAPPPTSSYQQENVPLDVARTEEKNVLRVKILVALILLLAVCVVATFTYLLVDSQERINFENQFTGYASEIVTVSREKTSQLFNALDASAVSISSQAAGELELRNTSWPFYRIPDWSVRAQRLSELVRMDYQIIAFAPIVGHDERKEWEQFANDAYPILYQDAIEKEADKGGTTAQDFLDKTVPYIHNIDQSGTILPASGTGDLLPTFQQYPLELFPLATTMPMGFDVGAFGALRDLFRIIRATKSPAIGAFSILVDAETAASGSRIVQPVFDRADTADVNRRVVGGIFLRLHWLDYFKNMFHGGDSDARLTVVLRNSCPAPPDPSAVDTLNAKSDHVVTFQIDGSRAIFLGNEDLHDPKYDSLEVSETFVDLDIDQSKVPDGLCVPTLSLHVYPSETLEKKFETHSRAIYTSVVVVIFTFTVL